MKTSAISVNLWDGKVGAARKLVETSLAKVIPITLGFLAQLIGLGGISKKIIGIIKKVRKPIDTALDKTVGVLAKKIKGTKIFKTIVEGDEKINGVKDKLNKKKDQLKEKANSKIDKIAKRKQKADDKDTKKSAKLKAKAESREAKKKAAAEKRKQKAEEKRKKDEEKKKKRLEKERQKQLKKEAKKKAKEENKKKKDENRKLKKDGKRAKLDDRDRKKHAEWAKNIASKLKKKGAKAKTFDKMYSMKKNLAEKLETSYQKKVKPGVDVVIKLEPLESAEKSGDIDFAVVFKDNTTTVTGKIERDGEKIEKETPPFNSVKGKMPVKVLELYGNSWFTAKDHLTTKKYTKVDKELAERENLMKELVTFRAEKVKEILTKVIELTSNKIIKQRGKEQNLGSGFSVKEKSENKGLFSAIGDTVIMDATAPGSQNITSDLDVTFSAPNNEDMEVDAVNTFINYFKGKMKYPSGAYFDTNAYTNGFMSKKAGKDAKEQEELFGDEKAIYEKALGSANITQLALGLLSIREYFGITKVDKWYKLCQNFEKEISVFVEKNNIPAVFSNKIDKELKEVFTKTESLYKETKKEKTKGLKDVKKENKGAGDDHVKTMASDKLYIKQLSIVKSLLQQRQSLIDNISKIMRRGSNRPLDSKEIAVLKELRERLATNMNNFDMEQGKALVYANEASYNAGSVIHVVKGMQLKEDIHLGQQQLTESILMNIGSKLQHFEENLEKKGEGAALINTSKYGERVDDALDRMDKLNILLKKEKDILDNDTNLVKNYKGDETLSQAEKEEKAEKDFCESMSEDKVNEGYLGIAKTTLVSFYTDKLLYALDEINRSKKGGKKSASKKKK